MATDRREKQISETDQHDDMPFIPTYRPNLSGLAALAGTIIAVSLVFHGFIAD